MGLGYLLFIIWMLININVYSSILKEASEQKNKIFYSIGTFDTIDTFLKQNIS